MKCFVTGTDTGVGKTYVTALLARALTQAGYTTAALKPVSCGDRDDAVSLQKATGRLTLDQINPVYLQAPLAPLEAARLEDRVLDIPFFENWFFDVVKGSDAVLVEGAGGWLVPFAPGKSMADLAEAFGLPVLIVAANRLGCLNHIFLTLESLRTRHIPCLGVILNSLSTTPDESRLANRRIIETEVPVLCEVLPGQDSLDLSFLRS